MPINTPTRLYKDIDLSFSMNPNTKDISKKLDVQAVKQALKILMNTQFYEKPFDPLYGSNIRRMLFEPFGRSTASMLSNEIDNAITTYEPRVKVEEVICTPNIDQHTYDVEIRFYVIGITQIQSMGIVLERLR